MDTYNFGARCKSYQAAQSQTACSKLQDLFFRETNKAPRCLSLPPSSPLLPRHWGQVKYRTRVQSIDNRCTKGLGRGKTLPFIWDSGLTGH